MSDFTREDAEAAGWTIVHEAVDTETEGVTLNSTVFRAEKYLTSPGRAGRYVEAFGHTEEGLLEAIRFREQQFAPNGEGTVLVPKEGEDAPEADVTEPDTFDRITDAEHSDSSNDTLTVLSDPSDPDSEPEQKVIAGGVEVPEEGLSEPTEPSTESEAAATDATNAGFEAAKDARDDDSKDDAHAAADAANAALAGDPGDSGNDPELVQPEAGEATDASDSEQQSQVPDAEAASSDAVSTNTDDSFPKVNESQPAVVGPDTDAEAPAAAPNAQPNESTTTDTTEDAPAAA